MERCFKLNGYSPGFQERQAKKFSAVAQKDNNAKQNCHNEGESNSHAQDNDTVSLSQYNQLLILYNNKTFDSTNHGKTTLLAGKICLSSNSNQLWIIDSGSTVHICPTLDNFHTYEPMTLDDNTITIPDGKRVKVLHKGTIRLNDDIILKNVLHVPDFHFRLIYVPKLCKDLSCSIVLTDGKCFLQGHSLRRPHILLGILSGGLYSLQPSSYDSPIRLCNAVQSTSVTEAQLWHQRMRHIPFTQMNVIFLALKAYVNSCVCQICPAARQAMQSFHVSTIKSKRAFQLLHIDIWGPYKIKLLTGCN